MVRHPHDSAGRLGPKRFYYYRTADSNKWLDIASAEVDAQTRIGFVPVAVDAATNRAFGLDVHNGFDALFTLALAGSGRRELRSEEHRLNSSNLCAYRMPSSDCKTNKQSS